jgi:septal ring factor EnvC (AmiA/AmiB activator)
MVLIGRHIICRRIAGLIMIFILAASAVFAQSIEDLRNERIEQLKEIEYTEKLLQQTAASRKDQVNRLNLMNRQIKAREQILNNLVGQIEYLERNIRNNEKEVELLSNEIASLKEEYAKMIYRAFLTSSSYNKAQYILAARDFNQAYKRLKYLQQYGEFRREQAGIIQEKSGRLKEEVERLGAAREEQNALLVERKKEMARLNNEKEAQRRTVNDLSKRERQLKGDLEQKKAVYERIEKEINKLLAAAMGNESGGMLLTPEMKIVSDDFTQNKGRMPWPVERGVITEKYGNHRHPVLTKVMVNNPGINLATEKGEEVRAIFKGTVKNIFQVPGANMAIIIQHGEYFTVYQGLVDVAVKEGDKVEIKQTIGKAFAGEGETSSQVHFQVYKGTEKLDPESWLAK